MFVPLLYQSKCIDKVFGFKQVIYPLHPFLNNSALQPDQLPGNAEGLPCLGVNTGGLTAGGLKPGRELWLTGVTAARSPKCVVNSRF